MITIDHIISAITNGTPLPESHRGIVIRALSDNVSLAMAIKTHTLKDKGLGLHKADGGAYTLSAQSYHRTPSAAEAAYKKYKDSLS